MSDISPSSIRTDAALEEALKNAATPDEMKAVLADAAIRQGLVTRDYYDPSVLLVNERAAAPIRVTKSIVVDGKELLFEGADDAEVDHIMLEFMRGHTRPVETEVQPEVARDERGRFTSAEDAAAKAELELQFKRGDISTADYLDQSGAIDSYLENQGISIDDVKKVSTQAYEQSWESATREFLERHANDWQGGEAALKAMGDTILSLHLDNQPNVDSLEAAYRDLVRRNAVPENHELNATRERHERIANASSVEEIRSALGSRGSLFDRR